jgi:hypothetical protein
MERSISETAISKMGSRIFLRGVVFVGSPCPHPGCKESVTVRIPVGEEVRNGHCLGCGRPVHAHHFDNVVKEGHAAQLAGL